MSYDIERPRERYAVVSENVAGFVASVCVDTALQRLIQRHRTPTTAAALQRSRVLETSCGLRFVSGSRYILQTAAECAAGECGLLFFQMLAATTNTEYTTNNKHTTANSRSTLLSKSSTARIIMPGWVFHRWPGTPVCAQKQPCGVTLNKVAKPTRCRPPLNSAARFTVCYAVHY